MSQKGFDEFSSGTPWSASSSSTSDPFSSRLNSPFGSEFGSTTTESTGSGTESDEDFMAELTRQMANYMLDDDVEDEEEEDIRRPPNSSSENRDGAGIVPKWSEYNSTSIYYCDQKLMNSPPSEPPIKIQPMEVYQIKNQPPVKMQLQSNKGNHQQNRGMRKQGHGGSSRAPSSTGNGTGTMRAVFLGGSGSRNSSAGTGVFLPRVVIGSQTAAAAAPKKKKPAGGGGGCSSVLIPAKVLQALELHFNNLDASSQSDGYHHHHHHGNLIPQGGGRLQQKPKPQLQRKPASTNNNQQSLQLPEEWTY